MNLTRRTFLASAVAAAGLPMVGISSADVLTVKRTEIALFTRYDITRDTYIRRAMLKTPDAWYSVQAEVGSESDITDELDARLADLIMLDQ